jgi:bifunctional non-homologous end joining protein LigD
MGEQIRQRVPRYVIQKHAATRLHYDLRLECDGVLLSWAVPKGPSLNPANRRLAVRVEDHPLEYADFEGAIADADYGAGTVMVWDTGTFQTGGAPLSEQIAAGYAEFVIDGRKLHGGWKLLRWQARGPDNWLLVKRSDEHADRLTEITVTAPDSALTGRSMDEIAAEARP